VAKGILGDDGPSVWTFIAVVLMWGAFKTWFSETSNTVKSTLGIGRNTAGPMQAQTSADIERSENVVKSIPVSWSRLPKSPAYYQSIADKLWKEMNSSINIDEYGLISTCRPLSTIELLAVAKSFGVKENSHLGLTVWSGNIFQAMDIAFDGMFKKAELAQMKKIWAPTKMW
jgi:hypothetical protein